MLALRLKNLIRRACDVNPLVCRSTNIGMGPDAYLRAALDRWAKMLRSAAAWIGEM
jgi:hypothetical protein